MKITKVLHQNKNSINKFFLFGLLVLSVLALIINRGFHFYEEHSQVRVELSGSNEALNEVFSQLNLDQNLAKIDRTNKALQFEGLNAQQVGEFIQPKIEGKDIQTSTIEQSNPSRSFLLSLLGVLSVVGLASLGMYAYFILKVKQKFNLQQISLILATYIFNFLLVNLILIGLISVVSRFYQVINIDLLSLLTASLWISILYFIAIWELKYEKFDNINSLYASLDLRRPVYVQIALVIIATVALSLGTSFVFPALFIFGSIFLSNFVVNNLGNIFSFPLDLKPPKINFLPIFKARNKKIVASQETSKPKEQEKKHNKRKRKK